jgi:hypothetical protein
MHLTNKSLRGTETRTREYDSRCAAACARSLQGTLHSIQLKRYSSLLSTKKFSVLQD